MIDFQAVWGWQPALYLFLGGVGAGAFVVAGILYLRDPAHNAKTAFVSTCMSVVCLAVGLVLLLSELTNPLRGLMMWQSFSHFSSWMCIGAWLLFVSMILFFIDSLFLSGKLIKVEEKTRLTICRVLSIVGSLLGLGVAVYTGVLLMVAQGIPFWNTPLLPCLFTVSAIETGVAAVMIVMQLTRKDELVHSTARVLEAVVIILVALETTALVAYIGTMLAGGDASTVGTDSSIIASMLSAKTLISGEMAGWFWILFVGIGLVVPLVAAICSVLLAHKPVATKISIVGATCALVGGCALRFLIVFAGAHADYLLDAVSRLLY